jgi:hypothetical protein
MGVWAVERYARMLRGWPSRLSRAWRRIAAPGRRGDLASVGQRMVNGADAATLYGVVTLLFNWTM